MFGASSSGSCRRETGAGASGAWHAIKPADCDEEQGDGVRLNEQQYGDFGPTLAAEKLAERKGITRSVETLRGWLRGAGVMRFQRRKRSHRVWRARKAHVGALLQTDGSHHARFEGRGPTCVLMAYSDDASRRVSARFYE